MVEEEADIEETEATWEDDTQTKTNVTYFTDSKFCYIKIYLINRVDIESKI